VLFVLIGLEVLLVTFTVSTLAAAALAMGVTLAARALTVGLPVAMLPGVFRLPKGSGWVLTWGGLRGGISVALALSLPLGPGRDIVLTLTYCKRPANYRIAAFGLMSSNFRLCGSSAATASGVLAVGRCSKR
jgi:NhaP-type Na+/H+ or K+/H+ antiporter